MRVDSLKAAFTYSSEALAMIPAEPPSHTWVWAAATHVMAARYMGHDEDAERVARQALRIAEELRLADAQADLIISLVGLEDHNRRAAEGRERLREARDLARRAYNVSVEMRALFNLAIGAYESGALDECLTWLAEGLERANRSGLVSSPYALELRYLQSLILYTLGRWDECARAAAVDAERLPPAGGFAVGPALYVALARGEEGAAERARALLDGPFDWMATLVAGIVLTDDAALRGDPEGAVASVRATLASLSDGSGNGRPDIGVRLAALALSAVADAAVELRLTGDGAGARRWADLATELVEVARSTAAKGRTARGRDRRGWHGSPAPRRSGCARTRVPRWPPGSGRSPRSTTAIPMNWPAAKDGWPRRCSWRTVGRRPPSGPARRATPPSGSAPYRCARSWTP